MALVLNMVLYSRSPGKNLFGREGKESSSTSKNSLTGPVWTSQAQGKVESQIGAELTGGGGGAPTRSTALQSCGSCSFYVVSALGQQAPFFSLLVTSRC